MFCLLTGRRLKSGGWRVGEWFCCKRTVWILSCYIAFTVCPCPNYFAHPSLLLQLIPYPSLLPAIAASDLTCFAWHSLNGNQEELNCHFTELVSWKFLHVFTLGHRVVNLSACEMWTAGFCTYGTDTTHFDPVCPSFPLWGNGSISHVLLPSVLSPLFSAFLMVG